METESKGITSVPDYVAGLTPDIALVNGLPLNRQFKKFQLAMRTICELAMITAPASSQLSIPSRRLAELNILPKRAKRMVLRESARGNVGHNLVDMIIDTDTGHLIIMETYKEKRKKTDDLIRNFFAREVCEIAFVDGHFIVQMWKGIDLKRIENCDTNYIDERRRHEDEFRTPRTDLPRPISVLYNRGILSSIEASTFMPKTITSRAINTTLALIIEGFPGVTATHIFNPEITT